MMRANKKELVAFLKNTQRSAVINGKPMPQVQGCIIRRGVLGSTEIEAVSLVRDGITSVSTMFGIVLEMEQTPIVIPDIEKLLGALKAHNGTVSLYHEKDKLRLTSARKQTTLTASKDALAFPHTELTVVEWEKNSKALMDKITPTGYTMKDGSEREFANHIVVKAGILADAINSGNINGQKVSRFTLKYDGDTVKVCVGQQLKGESVVTIGLAENCDTDFTFEATFEGGLENITHYGEVRLKILDFTAEGAGLHLILSSATTTLYQRGLN